MEKHEKKELLVHRFSETRSDYPIRVIKIDSDKVKSFSKMWGVEPNTVIKAMTKLSKAFNLSLTDSSNVDKILGRLGTVLTQGISLLQE